jgi:type IV secretion system protein TrbL
MDPTLLQEIITPLTAAISGWWATIYLVGLPILFMLSIVEFMAATAIWALRPDLGAIFDGLIRSLLGIALVYIIFINADQWMRVGVIGALGQWGSELTGLSPNALSPDGVLQQGWGLAQIILSSVGLGTGLRMPLTSIVILLAGVAIFVVFAYVAIQLAKLQIETFLGVVAGSVLLPLGAFRFTFHLIERYVGWILSIGLRLFIILGLLGLAGPMVIGWLAALTADSAFITANIWVSLKILAQAIVFFMLIQQLPNFVAGLVVSGVMAGIGEAMGAMASVGAAAAGAGATAAAGVAQGAGAAADAVGAIGSTNSIEVFGKS